MYRQFGVTSVAHRRYRLSRGSPLKRGAQRADATLLEALLLAWREEVVRGRSHGSFAKPSVGHGLADLDTVFWEALVERVDQLGAG